MSATVLIRAYSGSAGSPTLTDVTALNSRFNTSDTHASSGTATPVPIPAAGTNYSYWVAYRLDCIATPLGTINNIRFYSDPAGSLPTGVTAIAQEATSYIQSSGTPGTTGLQLTTGNYATLTGAPVDFFSLTAGAPKSVAGSISNPSTGPFGSWFVVQVCVSAAAASTAALALNSVSCAFDES